MGEIKNMPARGFTRTKLLSSVKYPSPEDEVFGVRVN